MDLLLAFILMTRIKRILFFSYQYKYLIFSHLFNRNCCIQSYIISHKDMHLTCDDIDENTMYNYRYEILYWYYYTIITCRSHLYLQVSLTDEEQLSNTIAVERQEISQMVKCRMASLGLPLQDYGDFDNDSKCYAHASCVFFSILLFFIKFQLILILLVMYAGIC